MSAGPIKLIYIAGPYTGPTGWDVEQNIQRARKLGGLVVLLGAYPVIPHSNTAHFDGLAPYEFWLAGTMALMRRCDAVLFTTDWEDSRGAREERDEAIRLGIPVFDTAEQLGRWLAASRQDLVAALESAHSELKAEGNIVDADGWIAEIADAEPAP